MEGGGGNINQEYTGREEKMLRLFLSDHLKTDLFSEGVGCWVFFNDVIVPLLPIGEQRPEHFAGAIWRMYLSAPINAVDRRPNETTLFGRADQWDRADCGRVSNYGKLTARSGHGRDGVAFCRFRLIAGEIGVGTSSDPM